MTATSVLVEDKVAGKPPSQKYQLQLPDDRILVRDLIRLYVIDQVERFNLKVASNQTPIDCSSRHQGEEERVLNPSRPIKNQRRRECEAECERAFSAFSANGFFLLVDGNQVNDLDEVIEIKSDTSISFLRLTPLVGG